MREQAVTDSDEFGRVFLQRKSAIICRLPFAGLADDTNSNIGFRHRRTVGGVERNIDKWCIRFTFIAVSKSIYGTIISAVTEHGKGNDCLKIMIIEDEHKTRCSLSFRDIYWVHIICNSLTRTLIYSQKYIYLIQYHIGYLLPEQIIILVLRNGKSYWQRLEKHVNALPNIKRRRVCSQYSTAFCRKQEISVAKYLCNIVGCKRCCIWPRRNTRFDSHVLFLQTLLLSNAYAKHVHIVKRRNIPWHIEK